MQRPLHFIAMALRSVASQRPSQNVSHLLQERVDVPAANQPTHTHTVFDPSSQVWTQNAFKLR